MTNYSFGDAEPADVGSEVDEPPTPEQQQELEAASEAKGQEFLNG